MRRSFACAFVCLIAAFAWADDDVYIQPGMSEWGPMPRAVDETPPSSAPLADLRAQLKKLKDERDALQEDRLKAVNFLHNPQDASEPDVAGLQMRLGALLGQLSAPKARAKAPSSGSTPLPDLKKVEPPRPLQLDQVSPKNETPAPPVPVEPPGLDFSKSFDPLSLAQALFRAGNYDAALRAFRLLPQEGLKAEERVPVQYMIACCLRKSGKLDEASTIYREVANSRGDEQLASCAQWQLNSIRWQKDLNEQLARIRQRRVDWEKQP